MAYRRCYSSVIMCWLEEGFEMCMVCVWYVYGMLIINNRTKYVIITSLSNQLPLILNLKKSFINLYLKNSLSCQNHNIF